MYLASAVRMCDRDDCKISCTAATGHDVQTAYAEEAESFYGDLSTVSEGEYSSGVAGGSADIDEIAADDGEGDPLSDVGTGDEDMPEFVVVGLDDERKLVRSELEKGCGCPQACYNQFTEDELYSIRLSMLELQKVEKDMLLLGKLQLLANATDVIHHSRQEVNVQRKRVTYRYAFDGRSVCKSAFCFLHHISGKVHKNLQHHLKENGAIPREHGNRGRLPPNAFSFSTINRIVTFIRNYATVHGLPQPAARSGRGGIAPTFLPATEGYNTVHQKYLQACADEGEQAAKYHAFRSVWVRCLPHIKFMTPRTDVCHHCESFRVKVMKAITENDKTTTMQEFTRHVEMAKLERQYYLDCIHKAEESIANMSIPQYGHYTFDFAQSVHLPYHARQVGPLYFKSALKVQLFGICNDGTKLQTNYTYDESQSIGINGTKVHGPNAVISMLDHFFDVHSLNEATIHLHADNCVGQNKNRFVLGYLAWRVIKGLNVDITLSFMRVGHTRCFVDGNFGLIKQCYRSGDIDTVDQLSAIIHRSSRTNASQLYRWDWREWDQMINAYFMPVKGVRLYQHFHFTAENCGFTMAKVSCDSVEETAISLVKRGVTIEQVKLVPLPTIIPPAGLSQERKKYLYKQIRPHVWPEFQNVTCPRP